MFIAFLIKKVFRKTVPEMEGDLYSIAGQSTIRVDTSNTGNRPDWMICNPFLEEDGEISVFLKHVYALVDTSVQRYLERGFTSLTVCFGCTGGRHRSVYAAQHLAEHLYKTYAVRVHLIHREQNIETYWGNV